MALRKIVYEDDPLLRKQSREVKEISDRIKLLIGDMWETLYNENGVGLAAPQVGVLRRIVVIDTTPQPEELEEDDDDAGEESETEDHSGEEALSEEALSEEPQDSPDPKEPPMPQKYVLINPEIIWASDEVICGNEGCLSVPGCVASVERNERVRVKALDEEGEPFEIEADGLLAKALQHEIDHLRGVLIIDIAKEVKDLNKEENASDE